MNKGPDDLAPNSEARQKFDCELFQGPCFDLDLTATEAIEVFEEKKNQQTRRMSATVNPPKAVVPVP
jgi:hypothetical protein